MIETVISTESAQWAGTASLLGLLLTGLYAILRGGLVPSVTLDRMTKQWEARLAESEKREQNWKEAYEKTEAARDLTATQLSELMIYARASDAFIRALPVNREGS